MKKKGPDYLQTRGAVATGAASAAADAGPESLVAGGNLGAAISYGDITAGGVGTVTSVCDDRLVGFGHPMTFGGSTTLGLMPADAVYVQEDPVGPGFKVANMGVPGRHHRPGPAHRHQRLARRAAAGDRRHVHRHLR